MDAQNRKILRAFDLLAGDALGALSGGALALRAVGDVTTLRPIAEEMVTLGWLRPAELPDTYARTEAGRLAMAGPLDVTLYTRPGCHLCDEAKALIGPMLERAGATLREINIDEDETLRERYNTDIPVIFLGTRKVAKHRVDPAQFERQLKDARKEATQTRR